MNHPNGQNNMCKILTLRNHKHNREWTWKGSTCPIDTY